MTALTFVRGLGHATTCACARRHQPKPARYIWHHILPQVCGGPTAPGNLVSLCDNAHYAIHDLMYRMSRGEEVDSRMNHYIYHMALEGVRRAREAGTISKMPKES